MRRLFLTLLLALAWWAAQAQTATSAAQSSSSGVTAEQQAALEALERGEMVSIERDQADQPESKPESKPAKRELYTFDRLYEKYSAQEGVTSILFGKRMMQMMADRVREEDRELAKLLEELRSIRVLTNAHPSAQFEADARSILKKLSGWELISQIEEHGQQIESYLFDGGRWHPSTFLLFSFGDKEQVVLYIQGYFSVKDISRLSEIRPN